MTNPSEINVNSFDTDFRFEVLAACLIEQGVDPQHIEIVRKGIARRGISKDVENVFYQYSAEELLNYLVIEVNREGLYDMLPQGLFHKQTFKRTYKDIETDVEKALDEIKIHREQEFFARNFFHLFEIISDKSLIEAYLQEAKYDRKTNNKEFVLLFYRYWDILKMLNHKQALFFMYIIPIVHKIRLDHSCIAEAFSFVLDVPVKLSYIKLPAKKADRSFSSNLGEHSLGVDLVLGQEFDDGEFDIKVTIGPISAKVMRDFLATAPNAKILDELCLLFLPANIFVVKDFIIDPEDSQFILSDDTHATYLGINSFI